MWLFRIQVTTWDHVSVQNHASMGPIWIQEACAATWDHGSNWNQAAAFGHVWIIGPDVVGGLCWYLLPVLPQGGMWTMCSTMCWSMRDTHLTGPERATHPLTRELTLNPTGPTFHRRAAPTHTLGKCGPNPHRGIERDGSTLHRRGLNSVVNTDQLNYYPGTHPGLWVGTPQHLPYLWSTRVHEGTDPAES